MYTHRGPSAALVRLAPPVRAQLKKVVQTATAPFRLVQRARAILLAAKGWTNADIARAIGWDIRTVRRWRQRFATDPRLKTIDDLPRSGRPPSVAPETHAKLISLACDRPEGVPFRNVWTQATLRVALREETGVDLSVSEVGRILRAAELRLHMNESWLHSPDPEFIPKARRLCALYLKPPQNAAVVCVDEKTGMQALERKHPGRGPVPGHVEKTEFEYIRHGTKTLIAAFDIRSGKVFGQVRRRTADGLVAFMEALAKRYPVGEVYVVWDNLNVHHDGPRKRWTQFNERHGGRFHFVYTPLHASWLNQIELWFSILHRRVLWRASFRSADELARTVRGFIAFWNRRECHPFRWTFRGPCTKTPRRHAA